MIPIVYRKYTTTLKKNALKSVHCRHCGCDYSYTFQAIATGVGASIYMLNNRGASERSKKSAQKILERKVNGGVPAACPQCLRFQPNMVGLIRRRMIRWIILAAVPGFFATCFIAAPSHPNGDTLILHLLGLFFLFITFIFLGIGVLKQLRATSRSVRRRSVVDYAVKEGAPQSFRRTASAPPPLPVDHGPIPVEESDLPDIDEMSDDLPDINSMEVGVPTAPPVRRFSAAPFVGASGMANALSPVRPLPADIITRCACGKGFRVSCTFLGKRVRCKSCGNAFVVAEATT